MPTGSFAYEYEAAVEAYSENDNPVHQAGAAWALAAYSACSSTPAAVAQADLAIECLCDRISDLR